MGRLLTSLALVLASTAVASKSEYNSIKRKFDQIEKQQLKPGTRVPITSGELNAYVQTELPKVAPEGIRQPVVELNGGNVATGRAMIDFVRLRSAQGETPGFLLRTLLQGEHSVSVTTRVRSGGGTATVDIEKVEIEGIPIQGAALDFLIRNYLLPRYPSAKIGKPFDLNYKMDRLEVTPGMAWVVMK